MARVHVAHNERDLWIFEGVFLRTELNLMTMNRSRICNNLHSFSVWTLSLSLLPSSIDSSTTAKHVCLLMQRSYMIYNMWIIHALQYLISISFKHMMYLLHTCSCHWHVTDHKPCPWSWRCCVGALRRRYPKAEFDNFCGGQFLNTWENKQLSREL